MQLNTELNYVSSKGPGHLLDSQVRIKPEQTKQITPLVRAAVQHQIECWDFEGEIERTLGVYFKNLEQAIADLAAADDPETIGDEDVQALIESLKIET